MSGTQYKTGILITGNADGAVAATRLTDKELKKLAKTKQRGSSYARQYAQDINRSSDSLGSLSAMARRAAPLLGSVFAVSSLAGTVKMADQVQKLSLRIGSSTEALSEYRYVAESSGIVFTQLATAWQRQTRRVAEAAQGSGEAKDALKELGLEAKELVQLSPEEQFERIAEAMQGVDAQADKVRLAMRLWDTEGVSMLQAIGGGAAALREMREDAQRLGYTLSQESADAIAQFDTDLTKLQGSVKGLTQTLVGELVGATGDTQSGISRLAFQISDLNQHIPLMVDVGQTLALVYGSKVAGAFIHSAAASVRQTVATTSMELAERKRALATLAAAKADATATAALLARERSMAGAYVGTVRLDKANKVAAASSKRLAAAQAAVGGTSGILVRSLGVLGGPAGIALMAGAAMLSFGSDAFVAQDQVDGLRVNVDSLVGSMSKLTRVEVERSLLSIKSQIGELNTEVQAAESRARSLADRFDYQRGKGDVKESDLIEANLALREAQEKLNKALETQEELRQRLSGLIDGSIKLTDDESASTSALVTKEQQLLDALFPLEAQKRKISDRQNLLNTLYADGKVSLSQYTDGKEKLRLELDKLNNPLQSTVKSLSQEIDLLQREAVAYREGGSALKDFLIEKEVEQELRRLNADQLLPREREELEALIRTKARAKASVSELRTEAQKAAKEADPFAKAWEEATKRIDESFADAWRGAFDSFNDFKSSLEDAFKDLLANLAHQALTKPILVSLGVGSASGASAANVPGLGGASGGLDIFNLVSSGKGALDFLTGGGIIDSLIGVENFASGAIQNVGNFLADLGLEGIGNSIGDYGANLLSGAPGAGLADLGLSLGAGIAGNYAGAALGKGLFGKVAESNIGSTIGGIGGAIFGGPVGAFLGSSLGGLLDAAFGGDGKKRVSLGVSTNPGWSTGTDHVQEQITAASGLNLTAYTKRTGQEGVDAVKELLGQFGDIDQALFDLTSAAGYSVDLSGQGLSGKNSEAGHPNGFFFGSAAYNELSEEQLKEAPGEFIQAWLDAVSETFDAELKGVVSSLQGDAETLLRDYQSVLAIDEIIDSGDTIFADVNGLAETFDTLSGQFVKADESIADTLVRLDLATALMGAIGEETGTTVEELLKAQTQLDAVGIESAAYIISTMSQLKGLQAALDTDQLKEYLKGQESLWDIWTRQGDALAFMADAANEVDLPLLSAAMEEFGGTTLQLIGQIYESKDLIAQSFGSLIDQIQFDLLGDQENQYNYLKSQADGLAATISTLSDPQQILDAAKQIEQLTSQAYGLLGDEQQALMGEGIVDFLEGVNESVQAQLDEALQKVQADNDPNAPGSTANSLEAAFNRVADEMVAKVNAANDKAEKAAQDMQQAANTFNNGVYKFGNWTVQLPNNISVNVTAPEVG